MKYNKYMLMLLFFLIVAPFIVWAQYQLKSSVIANGVAAVSNESNRILGTVGQSLIGRMGNQTNIVKSGLWEQTIGLITDISIDANSQPEEYYLFQNYPNPFNPSTIISFSIPAADFVKFKIYDVLGSEVATLVNEERPAGIYKIDFDGSNLSSGVYFYTLQSGKYVQTKKLILMK